MNPKENKTSIPKRITLIFLGIFFCLALLEVGLRLGGFIFASLQEASNRRAFLKKDSYRILCLGESTTAHQYPPFLEEALNQRNIGIKFSVIDKGVPGINTIDILSHLEENLNTYKPDMVIAMMGNNDEQVTYYRNIPEANTGLFQHSSAYRFIRLLYMHIVHKLKNKDTYRLEKTEPKRRPMLRETGKADDTKTNVPHPEESEGLHQKQGKSFKNDEPFKEVITLNPKDDEEYLALGWFYEQQDRFPKSEEYLKQAIKLNPRSDRAYVELGELCLKQDRFPEAEEYLKRAIALNPENYEAYACLGELYQKQYKLLEAEEYFKQTIALNPKDDKGYLALGWFYRQQDRFPEAEEYLKRAIALNPKNDWAYARLGELRQNQHRLTEAEEYLKQAIALNPKNDGIYTVLGWFYRQQDRLPEAEKYLKQAITLNPKNYEAYARLGEICRYQHRLSEAEEYFKQAIVLNPKNDWKKERESRALKGLYMKMNKPELAEEYNKNLINACSPITVHNYRMLKTILDKRGIKLVCVQYPMRSVDPLKEIFEGKSGVIFVDNEELFKKAVTRGDYREFFQDMFAGDFGHCTDKGNKLLAENIANTVFKEVFGR